MSRAKSLGFGLLALVAAVFVAWTGRIDETVWQVILVLLVGLAVLDEGSARHPYSAVGWLVMVGAVVAGNAIAHPWGALVGGILGYLLITPAVNRAEGLD